MYQRMLSTVTLTAMTGKRWHPTDNNKKEEKHEKTKERSGLPMIQTRHQYTKDPCLLRVEQIVEIWKQTSLSPAGMGQVGYWL